MEKALCPSDKSFLAEKAFAMLETLWMLETAMWDLFYDEFLSICAEKTEEHDIGEVDDDMTMTQV